MTISFSDRVEVPKHVLVRFLDNESVFLNLETEHYYGLDEIGTRMWQAVTAAPYIEAAYGQLLSQFRRRGTTTSSEFLGAPRAPGKSRLAASTLQCGIGSGNLAR